MHLYIHVIRKIHMKINSNTNKRKKVPKSKPDIKHRKIHETK